MFLVTLCTALSAGAILLGYATDCFSLTGAVALFAAVIFFGTVACALVEPKKTVKSQIEEALLQQPPYMDPIWVEICDELRNVNKWFDNVGVDIEFKKDQIAIYGICSRGRTPDLVILINRIDRIIAHVANGVDCQFTTKAAVSKFLCVEIVRILRAMNKKELP